MFLEHDLGFAKIARASSSIHWKIAATDKLRSAVLFAGLDARDAGDTSARGTISIRSDFRDWPSGTSVTQNRRMQITQIVRISPARIRALSMPANFFRSDGPESWLQKTERTSISNCSVIGAGGKRARCRKPTSRSCDQGRGVGYPPGQDVGCINRSCTVR